jgi:hypothetical protein
MAAVGVGNEPLHERALFAFDGTVYRKVKINTSGELVVAQAVGSSLNVTASLAADQNVQARAYGWDGSAWRKLQLLFGYTDRWAEQVTVVSTGAGTTTASTTAVSAGYVHVAENIVVYHSDPVARICNLFHNDGAANRYLGIAPALAQNTGFHIPGRVILKAGDLLSATIAALAVGQGVVLAVNGFKMKIND